MMRQTVLNLIVNRLHIGGNDVSDSERLRGSQSKLLAGKPIEYRECILNFRIS
jgi:hypothetical protein